MKKLALIVAACLFGLAGQSSPTPPQPDITLQDFKLAGVVRDGRAEFTLTAVAKVENARGGSLPMLDGAAALTGVGPNPKWSFQVQSNGYVAVFERSGKYPLEIRFAAAVKKQGDWSSVQFGVAPATLAMLTLQGLAEDTQFDFPGAAKPERKGAEFVSFLPSDGKVRLAWKEQRPEAEGKLFYSAEMLSQISVSPGLMRQIALVDFKVMQGELRAAVIELRGEGEVTRVQGEHVLSWQVEPEVDGKRLLKVQLNEAQKDQFGLQIQLQTPVGAFPQTVNAVQIRPEGATRFAGHFRVVNDGAVRLEVTRTTGVSQVSPEQFPENDATKALLRATGSQRFVYRFSGVDFALQVQADQIQPELSVSKVLSYHLGENEIAVEMDAQLEIREAPLRELQLRIPRGYGIARLNATGMTDYFVTEPAGRDDAELRLVYGQPVTGGQTVQLRLERNKALGDTNWVLPLIEVPRAKSVRGHIGISADPGFRLTPERTEGLTEIATAFFPGKVAGLQAAYRLNDPVWQARVRVERLPLAVQADALHLFSVGEGIAYGSSVLNYFVSGAPVSAFRIELSEEYFNVEFTGKDVRNWQKDGNTCVVQLHTPVSGAYTLLATYEKPFKSQGETLAFSGARPLDAQSEQGYTLVISAYQFQVEPAEVSPGLLPLETAEVPPEYRLFFDAPVLAAYRYTARPFTLKLALSPLAQGDSLSQVIDRASLATRISKEGQVLTDVRYFVKNRGNTHLRLTLPKDTELWSALVNGATVVPVKDGDANLVPLPQHTDPNTILTVDLKVAGRSPTAGRVRVAAPVLASPVMLAEWKLTPEENQRLAYQAGSLTPQGGVAEVAGFAQVAKAFNGRDADQAWASVAAGTVFILFALLFWRWGSRPGVARFSSRHLGGALLGLAAMTISIIGWVTLANIVGDVHLVRARDLSFLVPIQQAGTSLWVEVANLEDKISTAEITSAVWPALIGLALLGYAWSARRGVIGAPAAIAGWTFLAGAALRSSHGGVAFVVVIGAFLVVHLVIPTLWQLWQVPPKAATAPEPVTPPEPSASGAAPLILLAGALWLGSTGIAVASTNTNVSTAPVFVPRAASVTNQARVDDKFVIATARIHWQAVKGQVLPLLFEPAVLTAVKYPENDLKLIRAESGGRQAWQMVAQKSGAFAIELQYQAQVARKDPESGFQLPTAYGLVNKLDLTLENLDVDVASPQLVSIERDTQGSNTVASLVLAASDQTWIGWKPRSRDVRRERAVFFADLAQLYTPAAGVIEGLHFVSIRPAQGELSELVLTVPPGATVTDVADAQRGVADDKNAQARVAASIVALWRFDPDTRKLRVAFRSPQSRPFALLVRSQFSTGPLPFEHRAGLVAVEQAAGQIGLVGIATGNEVQLDSVTAESFSPVNLEDFPPALAVVLNSQVPGATLRRAFRYAQTTAELSLKASPVEPDVRVEMQDTLSLGEDRALLAANATVEITRAGIFRLSFPLPANFDVETISGPPLSHWTELKTGGNRIITLHLNGKTEGRHQFAISLAGPGVKAATNWVVPQVVWREASKQRGTYMLVPEQGLRPQVASNEGVTQLDPQKAGIKQKGVLLFRVLQAPWHLALAIEQVDPWIQVTSLQHAVVTESLLKVAANIQYQIENTGLKALRVYVPANAESVRFQGDQVADFMPVNGVLKDGLQLWEVKLHRRVLGSYLLQVNYQKPLPEQATVATLTGLQAAEVNSQRGFVTVQSGGRLQLKADTIPAALQPAEFQSIPKQLQKDLAATAANLTFRMVEPAFDLALKLERHDAAKLLAARVNSLNLSSVISDDGVMLTQARLEILPGDKRLLELALPADGRFWFAFVNQNGVWPWREKDHLLIPLEQQSRGDQPVVVEVFYSCKIGSTNPRALNLDLLAPSFDLPLENIVWRVCLSEKWDLKDWSGAFQLQRQEVAVTATDVNAYLHTEAVLEQQRSQQAEQLMAAANDALQKGDPQQARRAFQGAFSLSTHDSAFNEDARVQLHNVKLTQALVGLNMRQVANAGEGDALAARVRELRNRKEVTYSPQDAKAITERSTADDNAAMTRLAERLIQQQDAAVSSPAAIRANIPDQGRVLTFKRAIVVDKRANLGIKLQAIAARTASSTIRVGILAATIGAFGLLLLAARALRRA